MKKYVYRHKETGRELTKEEVMKLRSFQRLKTDYKRATRDLHRNRLYKDPKLFLGLLLVLLILWILWGIVEEEEKNLKKHNPIERVD